MKVALLTNVVSPHQVPLAEALVRRVGEGNYRYVHTEAAHGERTRMGWGGDAAPAWCRQGTMEDAALLEADCVLSGHRALALFERRNAAGRATFYAAERWFKERRIKYQYIDLPSKGLSPREYQSVKQKVGFDALVNTKCRAYEDLYMAYITPDAREEKLLEHPELFVTPIVRNGREATVGYCPDIWQTWE